MTSEAAPLSYKQNVSAMVPLAMLQSMIRLAGVSGLSELMLALMQLSSNVVSVLTSNTEAMNES
jgi:hypothetical protein